MNQRIGQINTVLTIQEELFLPKIDEKAEYPQKFFNISDNEIDEYRIVKSQRELDAANAKKATKKKTKAAAAAEEEEAEKAKAAAKAEEDKNKPVEAKMKPTHNNANPYLNAVPPRKGHKKMETELDEEYDQIMRIELQYEK
jgi:hypothetical protein